MRTTTHTFFSQLGKIINNPDFALKLEKRTYESFETEHRSVASSGLTCGFKSLDEYIYFSRGDFITIQAMSNHGKSSFMLQLMQRFVQNETLNPVCVFITYETEPLRVEEKFLNILCGEYEGGTLIKYNRNDKYLYPDHDEYPWTKSRYDVLCESGKITILPSVSVEKLDSLIGLYQTEYKEKTIVVFLDYFQIIDTSSKKDGWEGIKEIAYKLEKLAIQKGAIIFAASQVNDKRQTREGKDIYNASTLVIDILDNSHPSLKLNKDTEKLFSEKTEGKSICSISIVKNKRGPALSFEKKFTFDGYVFSETKEAKSLIRTEV